MECAFKVAWNLSLESNTFSELLEMSDEYVWGEGSTLVLRNSAYINIPTSAMGAKAIFRTK